MGLFYRRPAAGVFAAFIASALVGFYISGAAKLAAVTAIVAAAVFAALLLLKHRRRGAAAMTAAIAASVSLALLSQGIYFDMIYRRAAEYTEEDVYVRATVMSQEYTNAYSSGYIIRIRDINGRPCNIKARLECEYISEVQPGYGITLRATAQSLGDNGSDGIGRYSDLSDGLMLKLVSENEDDYEVTDEHVFDLGLRLGGLNRALASRLRGAMPGQSGELTVALILGDRSGLSATSRRDFNRSGVSHLLALSGLHMTVVMGIVGWILKKLGVPKTVRYALLPFAALGYLALTGFGLSACRAAGMLFMMYFAYFLSARPDGITSLFGAVALIMLVSPASVVDIGLLLSMLATLGIILGLPLLDGLKNRIFRRTKSRKTRHVLGRILNPVMNYLMVPVVGTLAANAATCLVVWLAFGRLSAWSVVTNLILSPLVGVLLLIGVVALAFLWCPPVFGLLTRVCSLVAGFMLDVTHRFAVIPGGVVSLSYGFAGVIIVLMTAALLVLAVVRLRRRALTMLPIPAAILAFAVSLAVYGSLHAGTADVGYLRTGKNEVIFAVEGGGAVIVDMTDGGYTGMYSGMRAAEKYGAVDVSALVLTHYHQRHISSVYRLCGVELVERIYLPRPLDEREYNIMWSLVYNAGKQGCEVVIYDAGETAALTGSLGMTAYRAYIKRSTHPTLALSLDCGGDRLTYVGASVHEGSAYEAVAAKVWESGTVIFGAHGPVLKSRFSYSFSAALDCAVFATDACAACFDVDAAAFPKPSVGGATHWNVRLGARPEKDVAKTETTPGEEAFREISAGSDGEVFVETSGEAFRAVLGGPIACAPDAQSLRRRGAQMRIAREAGAGREASSR